MSGIVGIFQRDGAPVDAEQIRKLVVFLEPSGSNSTNIKSTNINSANIWIERNAGLGHGPLGRSSASGLASLAAPPLHIAADARLDSRAELRTALLASGSQIPSDADDAQLLLHAYVHWGAHCVDHLRGEFAFAIWDAHAQTLFCARDHFGIKPFYYALFDSVLVFSNVLNAVRLHPRVSAGLNDSAVADFLLFGLNCDNATTTFRDLQRLPPAHSLLVTRDAVHLRRYWDVPVDGRIRHSRPNEYIENFLAVWKPAVADRLDAHRTGILLSGGLDSAAVAATANSIKHEREANTHSPASLDLRAYTVAHGCVERDRDPTYAVQLAGALQMPQQNIYMDSVRLFEQFDGPQPIAPEPVEDPLFAGLFLTFATIAEECRVVLSGEGADNLMHFQMWAYAADLRRRGEYGRLLSEISSYAWRRPFPWRGILARAKGFLRVGDAATPPFPKWIAPDFARSLDLPARWKAGQLPSVPPHAHPIHPKAHASMYLPQWTRHFELENAAVTRCSTEVRYPFLDLRVVAYLLAIPPFPWFFQKGLLREAMAGRVLDSVRLRPKTFFAGDPVLERLRRPNPFAEKDIANRAPRSDEAGRYINCSFLAPLHGKMTSEQVNQMARPLSFNFWLQSIRRVGYN